MMRDQNKIIGEIDMIRSRRGRGIVEVVSFHNAVLVAGKVATAKSLAGDIGSSYDFYICKMLFGTNGVDGGGIPKSVDPSRTALFGPVAVTKNAMAIVDESVPGRAIFTSTLLYSDGNGMALNEFALQMYNGDLYSMATRESTYKDSDEQLTFIWKLTML